MTTYLISRLDLLDVVSFIEISDEGCVAVGDGKFSAVDIQFSDEVFKPDLFFFIKGTGSIHFLSRLVIGEIKINKIISCGFNKRELSRRNGFE